MSFEEHIKSEHNMWHYLYFLVLVRVKDPTEYTGPESYVAQMIAVSKPTYTHMAHTDTKSLYPWTLTAALSSKKVHFYFVLERYTTM